MDGGERVSVERRGGNEETASMRNKCMENYPDGR